MKATFFLKEKKCDNIIIDVDIIKIKLLTQH